MKQFYSVIDIRAKGGVTLRSNALRLIQVINIHRTQRERDGVTAGVVMGKTGEALPCRTTETIKKDNVSFAELRCTKFTKKTKQQHWDENWSLIKIKKQNWILFLWAHFSATGQDMKMQCPLYVPYEGSHAHIHTHTLAETCPDAGAAEGCEAVHTDDKGSAVGVRLLEARFSLK